MGKLKIEYRTKEQEGKNHLKGKTYWSFTFDNKITKISIAPEETRKLEEIVKGIEKELQDGFHLQKDESFEIEDADQCIMDYEKENGYRIDSELYPYTRYIFQNKDNPEVLEALLKEINESRCK